MQTISLFDAHMHYSATLGDACFEKVLQNHGIERCTLACIAQEDLYSTVPDALRFKARRPAGSTYVMGSLERSVYVLLQHDENALAQSLLEQAKALLAAGCDGIKLLEGKPDIRRNFPIPDFDLPVWEPFWRFIEQEGVPLLWHVNDPEDFWNAEKINPYAKSAGWFYGPETINNEEQYRQVFSVLARHPNLRLQLAHCFFFSAQLPRFTAFLRRYPNVYIDIAPGIELFTNFSKNIDAARAFFQEFGVRILYGSDIGSRATIAKPPRPLDESESAARVQVIRTFLETDGSYILEPDGKYLFHIDPTPMHGLGLARPALEKIYMRNALAFFGAPVPVHEEKVSALEEGYQQGLRRLKETGKCGFLQFGGKD